MYSVMYVCMYVWTICMYCKYSMKYVCMYVCMFCMYSIMYSIMYVYMNCMYELYVSYDVVCILIISIWKSLMTCLYSVAVPAVAVAVAVVALVTLQRPQRRHRTWTLALRNSRSCWPAYPHPSSSCAATKASERSCWWYPPYINSPSSCLCTMCMYVLCVCTICMYVLCVCMYCVYMYICMYVCTVGMYVRMRVKNVYISFLCTVYIMDMYYIRLTVYTYIHIHTYIHTCTYIHSYIYTSYSTYIHTHTHTYILHYIYTYIHTYTYIHFTVHTYIRDSWLWAVLELAGEASEPRHFAGGQVHPRAVGESQPHLLRAAPTGDIEPGHTTPFHSSA